MRRGMPDSRHAGFPEGTTHLCSLDRPRARRLQREVDEVEAGGGDRANLLGDGPAGMIHLAELHWVWFRFTPRRYIRGVESEIRALAESVGERLVDQGAKATLLTGSHARGHARPDSDVDLFAVGDGPAGWMEIVDDRLVAVYWWTAEEVRRRLTDPESALLTVRGLRDAVVLQDPTGIGAELQREAREWTWEKIEREADAWVADKLVVWSEYLPKLAGAVEADRRMDAAAVRSQLTVKLAELLAVRRRLTEES